jgi:hypothetical protein
MLISSWAIWTKRRKAIHVDNFQNPISTFDFINRLLHDLEGVNHVAPKKSSTHHCSVLWIGPPSGLVKTNVVGVMSREAGHRCVQFVDMRMGDLWELPHVSLRGFLT